MLNKIFNHFSAGLTPAMGDVNAMAASALLFGVMTSNPLLAGGGAVALAIAASATIRAGEKPLRHFFR